MPFSTTQLIASTDVNNILRGLNRDNADSILTGGGGGDTTLKSFTIPANTIGATGLFRVIACGTLTGVAGPKTIRLKFGITTIATNSEVAGTTSDWFFDAWCLNTSATTQKWFVLRNTNDALTTSFRYTTSGEDTTAGVNLIISGQLGNVADTITVTMFNILVAQVN